MAKPHIHVHHYNAHCWSWAMNVHGCDYLSNFRMRLLISEEKNYRTHEMKKQLQDSFDARIEIDSFVNNLSK